MNNPAFFTAVRKAFGSLSQAQVDGFNMLLLAAAGMSMRHAAYLLATAWHETARTMQPIAEYGKGRGRPYGRADTTGKAPYGRGYVQLTWRTNYQKADSKLGLGGKLAADYDLALQPGIAARIIVQGMSEGWFTGKRLADFTSYRDMRKIVNGTDKAELIAGHAAQFEAALLAAGWGKVEQAPSSAPSAPAAVPSAGPAPESHEAAPPRGILKALLDLLLSLFATRKG